MLRTRSGLWVTLFLVSSLVACKENPSDDSDKSADGPDGGVEADPEAAKPESGTGGGGGRSATAGGGTGGRSGSSGVGGNGGSGGTSETKAGNGGSSGVAAGSGGSPQRGNAGSGPMSNAGIVRTPTDIVIVKVASKPDEEILAAPGPCQDPAFYNAMMVAPGADGTLFIYSEPGGNSMGKNLMKCVNGSVVWTATTSPNPLYLTDIASDGTNLYYLANDNADLLIGAIDANGTARWQQRFGTSNNEQPLAITASQAGVYVMGNASSQLPKQPVEAQGRNFIAKFDLNGNPGWSWQHQTIGDHAWDDCTDYSGPGSLIADQDGNVYMINGSAVTKFNAAGDVIWKTLLTYAGRTDNQPCFYSPSVALGRDGANLFVLSVTPLDVSVELRARGTSFILFRLGTDGVQHWSRLYDAMSGTATIDAVEGVIWNGNLSVSGLFPSGYHLAATNSLVCTAVNQQNAYQNGSLQRRNHRDALVLCLNYEGDVKWINQFRIGKNSDPEALQPSIQMLAIDADSQNLVVVGRADDGNATNGKPGILRISGEGHLL